MVSSLDIKSICSYIVRSHKHLGILLLLQTFSASSYPTLGYPDLVKTSSDRLPFVAKLMEFTVKSQFDERTS